MTKTFEKISKEVIEMIKEGSVGASSTDTVYGVIASAFSREAVERIYKIKNRDSDKPLIVLISSINDIKDFDIEISDNLRSFLENIWPGPVSVIVPCDNKDFSYIHRGKNSIAFRLPEPEWLRELIGKTGPLVAPSANKSGYKPAMSIEEAKDYFNDEVDFYLDKGLGSTETSTLIEVKRV